MSFLIAEADRKLELKEAATRKRLEAIKQLMKNEASPPSLQQEGRTVIKKANNFFTSLEKVCFFTIYSICNV